MAVPEETTGSCLKCGKTDQFRHYEEQRYLGSMCTNCKTEYLIREYVEEPEQSIHINGHEVWIRPDKIPKEIIGDSCTLVKDRRTKIDLDDLESSLQPGDHIMWHRCIGYTHHAIVIGILGYKTAKVIQYAPPAAKCIKGEIYEKDIDLAHQNGQLYKVNYITKSEQLNPVCLVLNRARVLVGETKYNLCSNNCETFATFCKLGIRHSSQGKFLHRQCCDQIRQSCMHLLRVILKTVLQFVVAEGAEIGIEFAENATYVKHISKYDIIGIALFIIIEVVFVLYAIRKVYIKRITGVIRRREYISRISCCILEGAIYCLLAIGFSLLGEFVGHCICVKYKQYEITVYHAVVITFAVVFGTFAGFMWKLIFYLCLDVAIKNWISSKIIEKQHDETEHHTTLIDEVETEDHVTTIVRTSSTAEHTTI